MSTPPKNTANDLQAVALTGLDWTEGHEAESLAQVFQYTLKIAEDTIDWYLKNKQHKKRWATTIRFFTILLGTVTALLPTVGELVKSYWPDSHIGAGWTVVLLGFAGALLLLDRFYGYTSGWMRFIIPELQVRQIRDEFQLDWQT